MTAARGMRNNNPGNIEKSDTKWLGEVDGTDDRFCTFSSMVYGCRALIKTLQTYRTKYGLSTVREIIRRWAPSEENDTRSYVLSVASSIQRAPDETIPFGTDPSYYLAVAKAIARHECGAEAERIGSDEWEEAGKLAGVV